MPDTQLLLPIIAIAVFGIIAAIIWGRPFKVQAGGFRRGHDDTDEMKVNELWTQQTRYAETWDWPEWPVTREHGDRQPQARSYKANRGPE